MARLSLIQRNAPRPRRAETGAMHFDLIVIGAGPAGLSLAAALQGSGLRIAIVERQAEAVLADPAFDGREIALTHRSVASLRALGAWTHLPADQVYPLRAARVLNGDSDASLDFAPSAAAAESLGKLVSNHLIRRALFSAVVAGEGVTLFAGAAVAQAKADANGAAIVLEDGASLTARLLVAADSRFSSIRDQLGLRAQMNRLGRAMTLCRVEHERAHDGVATEWFDRGQTLALLPLGPFSSSAVLTLPQGEADLFAALDDAACSAELGRRFQGRWGAMRVASPRFSYPLVTSWSHRFAVPGAALIGDAAVGMHPVTAHGFNLGLSGAVLLARRIGLARRRGRDWAGADMLADYERRHRLACRPLYGGTNAIVRLFTDDRPHARAARSAMVGIGRRLPRLRRAVQRAVLHA